MEPNPLCMAYKLRLCTHLAITIALEDSTKVASSAGLPGRRGWRQLIRSVGLGLEKTTFPHFVERPDGKFSSGQCAALITVQTLKLSCVIGN